MKLKVPPAFIFIFTLGLMWLVDYAFGLAVVAFEGKEYFAVGFIVAGGLFVIPALWEFYRSSTTIDPHNVQKTSALVNTGIYRVSRNPMYVGVVCLLISAAFYLFNLLTLIIVPLFIWYINRYQIKPEEQMMEEKFGEQYRVYKGRVRRWL